MCLEDLHSSEKVTPISNVFGNRLIREDVRKYCEDRKLGEAQIRACIESAVIAHSIDVGQRTADRLIDKDRVRTYRHNHFDGPDAAA